MAPQLGGAIFTNPLGDAGRYNFIATATDELGGNTSTPFPIEVIASKEDLSVLILSYIGIAGSLFGIGATLFQWRAVLALFLNIFRRQNYWRENMPQELSQGRVYYPTNPVTSERIPLEEIGSIQVFRLHQEGCNILRRLSAYLNYNEQKEPLLNKNLPHYLTVSDAGGISIDFDSMRKSQKEAHHRNDASCELLFLQVTGYDGRILEMFEIKSDPLLVNTGAESVELMELLAFQEPIGDQRGGEAKRENSLSSRESEEEAHYSRSDSPSSSEQEGDLVNGLNIEGAQEDLNMTDLRKAYEKYTL